MPNTQRDLALLQAKKDKVRDRDIPHLFRFMAEPKKRFTRSEWNAMKVKAPKDLVTDCRTKSTGVTRIRTKLIQEMEQVLEKLIDALSVGTSLNMAAAFAGVKMARLQEWMARGHERPKSVYGAFLKLVQEAVAACEVRDLEVLSAAAEGGEWEAAAARLKMRGFGQQVDSSRPIDVKIVNYTVHNAPLPNVTPPQIDLDTLEVIPSEIQPDAVDAELLEEEPVNSP